MTTDTSAPLTTGTHGGARKGAGKPIGTPASQNIALVKRSIMEDLNIKEEYLNISPLDVLLGAMRHYYSKGALMEAVSCADKASKYMHTPKAARSGPPSSAEDFAGKSDEELATLAGWKKAA
jgi:hypothetical protein